MDIPSVQTAYDPFTLAAERCVAATNFHRHAATCIKGKRRRYMCCVGRPAGVFNGNTAPIQLKLLRGTNGAKGNRDQVVCSSLTAESPKTIDSSYDLEQGQLLHPPLDPPIAWKQHRSERDKMVVETNHILTVLTGSHTNSSVLASEDVGEFVNEY